MCFTESMNVSGMEAERIRELGVEQRSLWYWCEHLPANEDHGCYELEWGDAKFPCAAEHDKISVFTIAELGELLPEQAHSFRHGTWKWCCVRSDYDEQDFQTPRYRGRRPREDADLPY